MSDVDPIEFGRMQAELAALRRDTDKQTQLLEKLDSKLEAVAAQMTEAKGGWRMLMLLGGGAATMGSGLTWFVQHLTGKTP